MAFEITITVLVLLGSFVAACVFWLCTLHPEELVGVQTIYQDQEWRVYGLQRDGERLLIDAFPTETQALACALKIASRHHAIEHMQQVSFDRLGVQLDLPEVKR
ncbi:hypothetical protein [Deinococcus roseus]|uniref:Uncharacterized protein n=1 Tax=Deinococcus roseus TaxID=392414 RepID=A0ABQ2DDK4_9DEIO|nr:hypothetical protein [Deinococcus roseus]GGJ53191.1 hypothetical protein GCM10008938_43960 [Deinococcus roseus]